MQVKWYRNNWRNIKTTEKKQIQNLLSTWLQETHTVLRANPAKVGMRLGFTAMFCEDQQGTHRRSQLPHEASLIHLRFCNGVAVPLARVFFRKGPSNTNSKLKKCVIPFNSNALCPLSTKASSRLIKSSNDPQESGQLCWTNRKPLPMPAFPPLIWFEDFNKSASILKLGDIFVHWRLIASVEEDGPKCCAMCFKAT